LAADIKGGLARLPPQTRFNRFKLAKSAPQQKIRARFSQQSATAILPDFPALT
jgi:hypothetical protein